jgi:uroporphyrin-III C-methyltransferase
MTVYLVGAGPGDPGLLTRSGAELLARCDVVVHDRLANAALLELAPPSARRIDVGKLPRHACPSQDEINNLLVTLGREGLEVVRLKGGDPMVFGRGGEEAATLRAAGVPHRIVPGVTSAIAAPAAAGIPVTLRGVSAAFTVVSGHEAPEGSGGVAWEALGRLGGTIVVLMATATIGRIAERLAAGGLAADTPVAAVTDGTLPEQVVWRGTLAQVADAGVRAPATFVIGAVAGVAVGGPAAGSEGASA